MKGKLPLAKKVGVGSYHSGSYSVCHGDQSEEPNIHRNNGRQWEFLKRDVGDRLCAAIVALGVVDVEGRYKIGCMNRDLKQGGDIEGEGKKELKKM